MTGYASTNFSANGYCFFLEIKSYNHKYLDIFIKVPRYMAYLESTLKKEAAKFINRGKVEIFLSIVDTPVKAVIKEDKVMEIYNFLKVLSKRIGTKKAPALEDVILLKEFITQTMENSPVDKDLEHLLLKKFQQCLGDFSKARRTEGAFLEKDITKKVNVLSRLVESLEEYLPQLKIKQKEKIKKRVEEFLIKEVQRERLEQELSYMFDKLDVSEEISRLKQHIKNFKNIMKGKDACGKKLDFYTQEMLREINTLTVKSQDAYVSELSIEIKGEIEKIREQVQNVE